MYIAALDGLRGLAILLVMLSHANRDISQAGWVGVEIFFILSGYLITSSLLRTPIKQFYIKRAARILPALFLFLFLYLIFSFFFDFDNNLKLLYSIFLFYSNWLFAYQLVNSNSYLVHLWSLAVEEQFYLIFPFLLKFLNNFKIIYLFLFFFIYKIHYIFLGDDNRFYYGSDSRLSSFFLGCIVYLFSKNINKIFSLNILMKELLVFFSLFILLLVSFIEFGQNTLVWVLLSNLCMFFLLIFINDDKIMGYRILSVNILLFFGKLSFSLYLFHGVIFKYLKFNMNYSSLEVIVVGFVLTIILSVNSYYFVEKPFIKYFNRKLNFENKKN